MRHRAIGAAFAGLLLGCTPAERQRAANDAAAIGYDYAACAKQEAANVPSLDSQAAQTIALKCLMQVLPETLARAFVELQAATHPSSSASSP